MKEAADAAVVANIIKIRSGLLNVYILKVDEQSIFSIF